MIEQLEYPVTHPSESRLPQMDFNNIRFGRDYSDHMFISDFREGFWDKSRIVPYAPLAINPANATLHYGQSVFEGMKAYKNADGDVFLFRPEDNFKRLNISAERMCISQVPAEVFLGGLRQLISLDRDWVPPLDGTSLYIRPFIFATDEFIGVRPSETFSFMIITCPAGAYYSKPVKVKVETNFSRAVEGGTGYAKAAGNYGGSLYPAKLAQQDGYDQLIWTDARDHEYIEESGTMNVMFRINDTLVTPPVGDTILKGITRDSILTIARDMGFNVEERKVSVAEIIDACRSNDLQEAFGVGTAAAISSISHIGHNGDDYELPQDTSWAQLFLKNLDDIKYGRVEDKFGWMEKV